MAATLSARRKYRETRAEISMAEIKGKRENIEEEEEKAAAYQNNMKRKKT